MHIVKFQGGLGNQMFQYALYCKFQSMGYDTYADLVSYSKNRANSRPYQLSVFGINLKQAERKDIIRLAGNEECFLDVLRFKYLGKKTYIRERKIKYNPQILNIKEGYFNGYWQSERYFKDIEGTLLKEFSFPDFVIEDERNKYISSMIRKEENAVSIHMRFGDYLTKSKMYGGICTKQYYQQAIDYIKEKIKTPVFFVFSDNIELARQQFPHEHLIYVEDSLEEKGYLDMYLMSLCRHNIIANSSFSWWGAWLNREKEKIVVAPSRWLNNRDVYDIIPEAWIAI